MHGAVIWHDTVSYTHLDVYKRQALNSNSDFTAVSNTYTETYATTLPKKIRDFKVTTAYPGDASFEWKGINGAKAFQLQITKVSDSKKFKKPIVNETKFYSYLGTYTNSKKIKAGTFYSARVRSYVTLAGTKQKVYSPWSTVITFGTSPKKITAKPVSYTHLDVYKRQE